MKKITLLLGLMFASQSWGQDCNALTYYTENFESVTVPAIPACATTSGTNTWTTANNPGSGFESNTLKHTGNAQAADAWFFTKGFILTAGTYYKISYRYGNNGSSGSENLEVTLGTNGNSSDGVFMTHSGITGGTPSTNSIDFFPAPATGTYYFGFHATSAASQGNLYVDDIIIEPTTCNTPNNITVTNITTTSAAFSWDATSGNNTNIFSVYHYAYMTTNTPPASPPDLKFNPTTSISAEDLVPGTTYYLFVRSQCGPVNGDWSEAVSFTTPACESATVPYILDFESATVPAVPECTIAHEPVSGNEWVTANNPGSGFTSKALVYTGTNDAADSWFYTQGIQITEGTMYKVSYKYGNNGTSTENLKVTLNTNPNPNFQTGENFATHEGITGGTPQEFFIQYFNVPTGVYYFGFNAYSESGQGAIYVDDFKIEVIECGEPTNGTATDVTTTTATISWEAATSGNATPSVYHFAYGTTETPPTETEAIPGTNKELTELTPGTQYYAFVRVQCGPTFSEWITIPFTTEELVGLGENTFKNITAYPNPVKDILNLDTAVTIEKIEIYNLTGQLVHTQAMNTQNPAINLQQLAAGAYLVNITAEGGSKRIRIIKE